MFLVTTGYYNLNMMVALAPPKLSARIRTFVASMHIREQHVIGMCGQGILFFRANIYEILSYKNIILFTKEIK